MKLIKRNNILIIVLLLIISSSKSKLNKDYKFDKNILSQKYNLNEIGYNYFRSLTSATCATTSYDKKEIQEECEDGPNSYDRILKYTSFRNYILDHSYHSNGLNYVTSLFVDSDTHHFGNFMNDGVGMIILYIIDCCIIFWHILTYFLAAAILSFIIVVLCFGE